MKILTLSNLYPPDFIGGYEIAAAQVVDALRDRGHDVRVLAAAPRRPVGSDPHVLRRLHLTDEWSRNGMGKTPLTYRLDEAESRLVNASNVHALTTVLEEFGPDVVYVNNLTGLGGLGLLACLQYLKVPWAWQLGDCIPRLLCSTGSTTIPGLAEAYTDQFEGHYIVVSEQLRREIEATGITLRGRVEIVPNWITGPRAPARTSFYRGGHLRIMSAGQIARFKGFDIVIESAARLRDLGHEDFSIDLFGNLFDPTLAHLITQLDLGGHVFLKGVLPQKELLARYAEYDVFAFPTHEREPFGLVPLEAIGRGCIPIMTRRCGIAEWLVHGIHCLKTERTAEAFARVFAALLDGRIDPEPIARRGASAAWRDFHIDAIVPRIERILDDASRRPRAGAGRAGDAYRLARMAERLTEALLHDAVSG